MNQPINCKKCKQVMRDVMDDRTNPEYFLSVTEFNTAHRLGHNLTHYDLCESCWFKVRTFIEGDGSQK